MITPRTLVLPVGSHDRMANPTHSHDDGQNGAYAPSFMIKSHHDQSRDHRIHEVKRRGHTTAHVVVAVDQKQGRTIRNERQVNQCDRLAARYPEILAHGQHAATNEQRSKAKAVKQNGRVGHEVGIVCSINFQRKREKRNETIANSCKKGNGDANECSVFHTNWKYA